MDNPIKKIQRSHDLFYLTENKSDEPKESFKFMTKLIRKSTEGIDREFTIADWGCAAGAFPHFLKMEFPDASIVGFEFLPPLLDEARFRYPEIDFRQGSLLDFNSNRDAFDVTTVMGVISIFDNIEPILENLVRWNKKGGKILIHGMFNKEDIDVYVKYAHSSNYETNTLESGWNIVSRKTVSRILTSLGVQSIQFHDFEIHIDLPKNLSDPIRSWSERREDGSRYITNGLGFIQPQAILEITI